MSENAVSVKNLSVSYGVVEAIENITLNINEGESVCIVGPNGGGKTTFLNAVLGFLKPNKGEIKILGGSIKKAYSKISFVPQASSVDRNFPISVIESVMTASLKSGLHPFKFFKKADVGKALSILKEVGLEKYENRKISELSGGEFQRLLIARAIVGNPQILLLDEPTANVDIYSRNKIFDLLGEFCRCGKTVITVTHDLAAAKACFSKLAIINKELIFFGKPDEIEDISSVIYGQITDIERGGSDA